MFEIIKKFEKTHYFSKLFKNNNGPLVFINVLPKLIKLQSHIDRIFRKLVTHLINSRKYFQRRNVVFLPILKLIEIHVGK